MMHVYVYMYVYIYAEAIKASTPVVTQATKAAGKGIQELFKIYHKSRQWLTR